ncbi:ABC transporter permease [Paenibacillus sp. R14(2021)]|uniref:ABC transporter permease n=1 Tax=Paenibacillus sp. R14(2021) TaxID=2859228 RepID=UPI001C612EE6|nr:ABC transporter permease [Paenibacillus sp. R14(2021)]
MNRLWHTFVTEWPFILSKVQEHIYLSIVAVAAACVIAIPLGIYLTRNSRLAQPILNVVSVIQTIPSLAMFGFMIPLFGIGTLPAIVALTLYALFPILQNTYVGINEVDPAIIEAGRGMGMTRWQLLRMVQLPVASSFILAGVRMVAVQTISSATIATYIAAGGLGDIITHGIAAIDTVTILEGAIPVCLLVIVVNLLLFGLGKLWIPAGLRKR